MPKKNVCLLFNTIKPGARIFISEEELMSDYIINPNENDIGDEAADLKHTRLVATFIESAEMSMRGFFRDDTEINF